MRPRLPPLANSYWVVPGRLLAGEHPCAAPANAHARRIQLLLASGVCAFIDLTREGELPDYTGLLPGPGAEKTITEAFLPGTVPDRAFEARWNRILALPWPQQRAFYHPRERERMPENVTDWTAIEQAWTADDTEGH